MAKTLFKTSPDSLREIDLFTIAAQSELAKVSATYDESSLAERIKKAYNALLIATQI